MDESRNSAAEERHPDDIVQDHIAGRVKEGAPWEAIVGELVQRGYDPTIAREMVGKVGQKQRFSTPRTTGLMYLVAGIAITGFAIGVTTSSYTTVAEQGGTYVVCWGAALFGLYLAFRGIRQLVSGRKAK